MRLPGGPVWHPGSYQGGSARRRYFEGWYFKAVDGAGAHAVAAVPGISFSRDGRECHSFVQIISSLSGAHYFRYPVEAFSARGDDPFEIRVGENTFSPAGMVLRLRDEEAHVRGDLRFGRWSPWPVTPLLPGAMGWYRFVPGMETYHGILSMDHAVEGSIAVDGRELRLNGGRGYVEKDWGRSFPSSWVWAQTNVFSRPGVSVTVSIAKVPWMTGAFTGHIVGLLLDGTLHRFTTYTGAHLVAMETGRNTAHVVLRDRHLELELDIEGREPSLLKAPALGSMTAHDSESLGGAIGVTLRERRGGRAPVAFAETGRMAAIEVMNDRGELHAER
jgi:hypothetical protein